MRDMEKYRTWMKKWKKENHEKVLQYQREYYRKNRKRIRAWFKKHPEIVFRYKLKSKFGISLKMFKWMVKRQKGRCRICRKLRRLVVEHSHKDKRVRGLVCQGCNAKIAWFENYRTTISRYLEK